MYFYMFIEQCLCVSPCSNSGLENFHIYIYICQAYCLAKIKMLKSRTFVLDCILVVKSLSKCHIFMLLILISGTKM